MNTKYSIKNFRVFDSYGANIELKPITILTGCNSSGKSSIVKSVFLLDSFLIQVRKAMENNEEVKLDEYKFDFSTYPNNLLGRFDKVVNNHSDENEIIVEYSVYSRILSKDLVVRMVFCADENDELNNAYLKSFTVLKDDIIVYSSCKGEKKTYNLYAIKEEFYSFIVTEYAIHNYCGLHGEYELNGNISEEEYKKQRKQLIDFLQSMDKKRCSDILKYVRTTPEKNSLAHKYKFNLELLKWSKENDSFFNIPIIEWLNSFSKEEISNKVDTIIPGADHGESIATQKVLNDFETSDSTCFSDYFKTKENEYLNNATHNRLLSHNPSIPFAPEMEVDQMYIAMDPNNTIGSFTLGLSIEENNEKRILDAEKWKNEKISFDILYETIMLWNSKFTKEESPFYSYSNDYLEPVGKYTHYTYKLLCDYFRRLINEVLLPDWAGNMSYVSSARPVVRRLYTLDSKDDFCLLLNNYFESRRLFLNNQMGNRKKYEPNSFINKWVKIFRIGNSVSFHVDKEGLGVQIRLHKEPNDNGRLLADEGYGITQLISILLQIETAILSAQGLKMHHYFRMGDLDGYKETDFVYEVNTIAIEEPEIHLHPRMQSLLADMFVEAYRKYNIHFIIETHSEYLIRKLQLLVAGQNKDLAISNQEVSLLYIYSKDDAKCLNEPQVKEIGICKDGYLNDSFGPGFFDESKTLSRQLR